MTYGGTPKPMGPEYQELEREKRRELDAEIAHIRQEVAASEAHEQARAASARRPSVFDRIRRLFAGRTGS